MAKKKRVYYSIVYSSDEHRFYADMFTEKGRNWDPRTTQNCPTRGIAIREAEKLIRAAGLVPMRLIDHL